MTKYSKSGVLGQLLLDDTLYVFFQIIFNTIAQFICTNIQHLLYDLHSQRFFVSVFILAFVLKLVL